MFASDATVYAGHDALSGFSVDHLTFKTSETELLVAYIEQCKARLEHEGWEKRETRP